MQYFIVSGASRGLGNSLSKMLASSDSTIICMSRQVNLETLNILKQHSASAYWLELDFLEHHSIEQKFTTLLAKFKFTKNDKIVLINNAGQLSPIGDLVSVPTDAMINNISVNLIAPLVLSKTILNLAATKKVPLLIVNVSSPSAENPKPHWISYGLAKNGLNYLTSAIATEYKSKKEIKIISFYPGIMDTDMRKENLAARPALKKLFDWLKQKVLKKTIVEIVTPEDAARKLLKVINLPSLKNGSIVDGQKIV